MADENELEEERRLCYVGITRARKRLYLTCTFCRPLCGNTTYNRVSRFLSEVPPELIEGLSKKPSRESDNNSGYNGSYNNSYNGGYRSNNSYVESSAEITGKVSYGGISKGIKPSYTPEVKKVGGNITFSVGDKVEHKKFGVGLITSVEKENDDYKLEIQFRNAGMKRLMAAFANLTKME